MIKVEIPQLDAVAEFPDDTAESDIQEKIQSLLRREGKLPAISEPETERGLMGVAGLGLRGLAEGVTTEFPRMVGDAAQFVGIDTGKKLSDWADTKAEEWYGKKPQDLSWVENAIYEGSKMVGPSAIPGGIFAKGARILLGVGNTVKAAKLAHMAGNAAKGAELMAEANKAAKTALKIAGGGVAGLFGASQAQQTIDTANKKAEQLEKVGLFEEAEIMRETGKGIAPLLTGGIEAAGEYFGTKYLGKLFRLDEAEVVKRGAGNLIKDFLKTLGVEEATEIGQAGGQAGVEKYYGIRPEAEPIAEALEVIGPTAFMTILFGGAGAVSSGRKKVEDDTKDKDKPADQVFDKELYEKNRSKMVERFEKDLEKGEVTLKDLTEQRAEMDEQDLTEQEEGLAGAIDEAIVKRQRVEAKAKKAKPYEQKPTERKPPIGGRGEKKRDVQARERNQREIDARNLLEESPEAVKQIAKIEPEGVRADAELGRVDREIERKVKQVKKEQQPDIVKTKAEIEPLINRFARRVENHLPHGYTVSNEIKVNLRGLEDVQGALDLIDPILKVTKDRKKRIDTAVRTAKQNPELQDLIQNVMKGLGNDQAYQRKLKKAPPAKPLRPEIPTQGKVQEIEKPVIPPKTTGVKATESEKPIRHRKHAPTEAIGVVTGGKVDQLEEKFEIGWADEIGAVKKGSDLYYDVVGVLSGGPADQFFDAGLSVKRRGDKAAPEKPTVAEPHTIYDLRKSWPDLEFEIIGSGKDKLINIKTGVSEEFRSQWAGSAAGRGHIFDTARRLDKHLKEYFAKKSEEKLQASLKEKRRKAKEFGEKAFKQGKKRTPSQDENVSKLVSGLKPGEAVGILDAWTKAWDKANIAEPVSGVMMTPDNYVEHVKTQEKSGIKYTDEMEVEETGQVVKVEKDAAVMLRETDEKIESYNQLLDCLAS